MKTVATPEMGHAHAAGLTALASCGGCAAKVEPGLIAALTGLIAGQSETDPAVLAGLSPFDDAAVYRLDGERALVASVDFFPPLVDDPADYGAVAAANAVSDIYAMGGTVSFALVISGFPTAVAPDAVATTTRAAAAMVASCGGQLLGGHSIHCREPVFGLCVLGFVHPDRIWRKSGAVPGDLLMLSKPLGTGVLLSAGERAGIGVAVRSMRETNRSAAAALSAGTMSPSAVTDVTGYGLIGHGLEIAERSDVSLVIDAGRVPFLDGAIDAARGGARTSADAGLRRYSSARLPPGLDPALVQLLHDPQTSGGLLAVVHPSQERLLRDAGFRTIGHVTEGPAAIVVTT